ncbi:MAG: TonB-dependent receptor domain-containing protein [Flavobacteriales bacterium]
MKQVLKYYCFCIALVLSLNTNAQSFSVSGKISTSGAQTPVANAKIFLNPGHYSVSNKDGEYLIKDVKPGSYTLSLSHIGYKSISQKVKIDSFNLQLNFFMDSTATREIIVNVKDDNSFGIGRLNDVQGTAIYAGKKTEIIKMDDVSGNLATNNSRQIYAKIPGLNIWESDGAGIQLGIGGRGLSPHRTSNFNTRQNGYDISADALGYPESYYTPPAEAIDRIEIVRGAASLQYGTQFGGMVNFKLKRGAENKRVELLSRQTVGSFGFYNTFNSIGGTVKKWNYYVAHQYKRGDGWRANSGFDSHTAFSIVTYQPNPRLAISLEYTFMHYLAQQAGGLTDQMFAQNPRQSIRNRNWFKVNWNLAALVLNYKINDRTIFNIRNFGLMAERDALGFLGSINRADPLEERDFLQDKYRNFGSEIRLIHKYSIAKKNAVFLVGGRYYRGHTKRLQGDGNTGYGPDFYYLNPKDVEDSDFDFPSENIAVFSENIFYVTPKFSITPGLRYEYINTAASGFYKEEFKDFAGNVIFSQKSQDNRTNFRSFLLAGIGMSYKKSEKAELYGNISQNYRAINFNDMRIVNVNLKVDPNLKDESGYSADVGIRGNMKQIFNYDVSLFFISYNDRIGSLLLVDSALFNIYRYRTNISDSRNYGIESFLELDILKMIKGKQNKSGLSVFTNVAWLDARYINSEQSAFENKKVELVPSIFVKTGITFKRKNLKATYQYAYTGEQFTDATNSRYTSNAVNGVIPAYYVMDFSMEYIYKRFTFSGGINNLSNNLYFTRRADGYPGPGIIPSDGRSFYATVQVKI